MLKYVFAFTLATALSGFAGVVHASDKLLTVFAVDISKSSPFLVKDMAARRIAEFARMAILAARPGHELYITTLGLSGFNAQIDLRARVGNDSRTKPRVLAAGASQVIAGIPRRHRAGEIEGQDFTSLLDFFENFAVHDCVSQPAHLIIATDGVEWSPSFNGNDFVAGRLKLPQPKSQFLKGCRVTMLGVGTTLSHPNNRLFTLLAPQWKTYLEAAGAVQVNIVGSQIRS